MALNTIPPRVWNTRRRVKTYAEQQGNLLKQRIKSLCDNMPNVHFGGHKYASTFGPRMVLVKVDPKDLVCVPHDCSQGKVRVCQYLVLKEVPNETKMKSFYDATPETAEDTEVEVLFPNGRMECPDCGTYCDSEDLYCRGCGSELEDEDLDIGACSECGYENSDPDDKFCRKCGYEL